MACQEEHQAPQATRTCLVAISKLRRISPTPFTKIATSTRPSRIISAMPSELEYFVVDVFTATALAGNPLAVVVDTVGLDPERMQAVAREFKLSETTFIQRRPAPIEQSEGIRVRIFTTQEELPFAGHPTLGTASVLRAIAPETLQNDTVRLALNVGPVPVRFEVESSGAVFGEMTQRDPEFGAELN